MTKFKVKTTRNVNIRKDVPQIKADNLKGILFIDQVFDLDAELIEDETCQEIEGNKKWFRDCNGDFLWAGGFEIQPVQQETKP